MTLQGDDPSQHDKPRAWRVVIYCLQCERADGDHYDSSHLFVPCASCMTPEGPPHRPSARCESGRRPHCSCDVCF
jgi:hypothetical protein